MSDNDNKRPKEQDYMKTTKQDLNTPPKEKEGIEKPRVEGYPKTRIGLWIFIAIVLIILIIGIQSDMFGIFS